MSYNSEMEKRGKGQELGEDAKPLRSQITRGTAYNLEEVQIIKKAIQFYVRRLKGTDLYVEKVTLLMGDEREMKFQIP